MRANGKRFAIYQRGDKITVDPDRKQVTLTKPNGVRFIAPVSEVEQDILRKAGLPAFDRLRGNPRGMRGRSG